MILLGPRVTLVGVVNQYRRREKDSTIITALNGTGGKEREGSERDRGWVTVRIKCMVRVKEKNLGRD